MRRVKSSWRQGGVGPFTVESWKNRLRPPRGAPAGLGWSCCCWTSARRACLPPPISAGWRANWRGATAIPRSGGAPFYSQAPPAAPRQRGHPGEGGAAPLRDRGLPERDAGQAVAVPEGWLQQALGYAAANIRSSSPPYKKKMAAESVSYPSPLANILDTAHLDSSYRSLCLLANGGAGPGRPGGGGLFPE